MKRTLQARPLNSRVAAVSAIIDDAAVEVLLRCIRQRWENVAICGRIPSENVKTDFSLLKRREQEPIRWSMLRIDYDSKKFLISQGRRDNKGVDDTQYGANTLKRMTGWR